MLQLVAGKSIDTRAGQGEMGNALTIAYDGENNWLRRPAFAKSCAWR
ncbi:MAG: hypothetical protein VCE91_13845 [Nitrospinota bacterium]